MLSFFQMDTSDNFLDLCVKMLKVKDPLSNKKDLHHNRKKNGLANFVISHLQGIL